MTAPLPTGASKAERVREMFDRIAPRYDLVNRVMTFGMDVGWRRRTVDALRLAPGSLVADLACGTGDLSREVARAGMRPVGVDFSVAMLRHSRAGAPRVRGDVLRLPFRSAAFDGAVCGFALRNVTGLTELFAETARIVRPGGRVAFLETSEPDWRPARAVHRFYTRTVVPRIGGALSDRAAYEYLPASSAYLPSFADMGRMLASTGFAAIRRRHLGGGAAQLIEATRS